MKLELLSEYWINQYKESMESEENNSVTVDGCDNKQNEG